jgi:hypothetical protein
MTFYIGTADLAVAKQRDLDRPLIKVTDIRHRIVNITVGRRPTAICAAVIKYMICYAVFTRWCQKISQTVTVVTASVKEDERGGQGHTSASLLHQSAT